MKINTRKFGEIEIDEKTIVTMPEGLPGFPGLNRFVVLEDPKTAPFCWFQSIEDSNIALVIMSPFVFKPDYKFDLKGLISSKNWNSVNSEKIHIYVVINISGQKSDKKITANLIGPIVINAEGNEAFQVVLSDLAYSHQHNILDAAPEQNT